MSKILTLYKQRVGDDPLASTLLELFRKNGYPNLPGLRLERVMHIEKPGIAPEEATRLGKLFSYPGAECLTPTSSLNQANGPIIEISYQRAWTDPELNSIMHAAEALGIFGLDWVRLSTRFQFLKTTSRTAGTIAGRFLFNAQSQTIIDPRHPWDTLRPQGVAGRVEKIDIASMDEQGLQQLSDKRRLFLSLAQMLAIKEFYTKVERRPARDGEIEMIAAAWSDHCKHTSWLALGLLQYLQQATAQIKSPLIISAYEDNSGVMGFYGGWALNAKGETHISPTSIEPYGGISTKIGGVIRDPLLTGQGAWIWGATTIMGTCDPRMRWQDVLKGALHPLIILRESIRGIWEYSNPMGIPMTCSQYLIHPNNIKCFALGHALGILPEDRAKKGTPHTGDYVILIGGPTGRDGIHGATVSSGTMTSQTMKVDATHVQIGMPIEERCVMEAVPVLRDNDCIRACTDCGAAGLSSAVGEIASKVKAHGKTTSGVWVNLAWLILKCAAMRSWEKWLSESQERGVLAVPAEKLQLALEILSDFGVPTIIIGMFTDSGRCQIIDDPEIDNAGWVKSPHAKLDGEAKIVVDLPYSFLGQACPLPTIEVREPSEKPEPFSVTPPSDEQDWIRLVANVLGHYNTSDQSAAAHQFDQTVQGATVVTYIGGQKENMQDEIFAATPALGKPWTAGVANAVNQFYGDIDPATFGKLIYAQAIAKLVAAGFSPNDIACNVNVYTPKVTNNPENAWRLVQLVHGYGSASVILGVPIFSGKDSSSGTFETASGELIHAPLTLDVLALGRMPRYQRLIPKAFSRPGDKLVLYHPGLKEMNLGGSIPFDLFGQRGDKLPEVDLAKAREGWLRYHAMLMKYRWSKYIHSRSVVAEAGLIRRLFEMSIGNNLGCQIILPDDPMLWLFAELHTAILFATSSASCIEFLGDNYSVIGEVIDEPRINVSAGSQKLFSATTGELSEQWSRTFSEVAL